MSVAAAHYLRAATPLVFAVNATASLVESERRQPARHLDFIDRAIVDAINGERPERVIVIEAPPRHGKSELVSRWLPAWYVGSFPDRRVMLASYSGDFAREWGRQAKDTIAEHGREFFSVALDRTRRAASEWALAGARGGMVTAGIGGGFTGRGAHLMIIDDPIKNAEEAISETVRENHWSWWISTAFPRLEPTPESPAGGLALVMATRWHEDDLSGRLLRWGDSAEGRAAGGVRRISLPAYAGEDDPLGRKPGEPLWPERLGRDLLELRRAMLDAYWWESLYQQHPGTYGRSEWPSSYFSEIWCDRSEWPDRFAASVVALDPSKGAGSKRGDYSATVFVGLARSTLWVDAQVRRRPVPTMCSESVAFAHAHGCDRFGVEANAFQDLLVGPLDDASSEAGGAPLPIDLVDNTVNKQLRISRLGPWLARGKFRFLRNPDTERLLSQLRGFPFAEHDDGPDGLEMALRVLRAYLRSGGQPEPDDAPEEVLRV